MQRESPPRTAAEAIERWRIADDARLGLQGEWRVEQGTPSVARTTARLQALYRSEWEWRVRRRDAEAEWLAFQCVAMDKPLRAYRAASQRHALALEAQLAAQRLADPASSRMNVAAEDALGRLRARCVRPFPQPPPGPLPPELASAPVDGAALDAPPRTLDEARARWEGAGAAIRSAVRELDAMRSMVAGSDAAAAWHALACPDVAGRYLDFRRLAEQEYRVLGSIALLRRQQDLYRAELAAAPGRDRTPLTEAMSAELRLMAHLSRLDGARQTLGREIRAACPRPLFGAKP